MENIRTDYTISDINSLEDIRLIYNISETGINSLGASINEFVNNINAYKNLDNQIQSFNNSLNNINIYLTKPNKNFNNKPNKGDNNYNIIKGFICFEE